MFRLKISIALGILTLLSAVNTCAAGSDHTDPAAVRAAFEHRGKAEELSASSIQSRAAAAKTSALLAFSLRGTGTSSLVLTACPGVVCNASSGGCACYTLQGTLNATQIGNANWTANITVNTDDCTNTGTPGPTGSGFGFCCYGGGLLSATTGSGKSASTIAMSLTGPVCSDPNDDGATSIQGGFIILTASSSGKFLHSAGAGQINASVGTDTAGTTYLSGNGVLQVVSPF